MAVLERHQEFLGAPRPLRATHLSTGNTDGGLLGDVHHDRLRMNVLHLNASSCDNTHTTSPIDSNSEQSALAHRHAT
ncbi:MAG: hypothetical protein CMI16_07290 [Opitutaceae bacterium]|nr:hypothetical protein [Opitutaceae bacterium]